MYCESSLKEFPVVALVETWLQNEHVSDQYFFHDYTVVRKDRDCFLAFPGTSRGGGALLAIRDDVDFVRMNLDSFVAAVPVVDVVGCKCKLSNVSICVLVVYVPPSISVEMFSVMFSLFEEIATSEKYFVLLGDFNAPQYNCSGTDAVIVAAAPGSANRKVEVIDEFLNITGLSQHNSICNEYGRLLDLIFSNIDCTLKRDTSPLVTEDAYHPALIVTPNLSNHRSKVFPFNSNIKSYNFRRADLPSLYSALLNYDWNQLESMESADIAVTRFTDAVHELFDQFVPLYKGKCAKYPCWYTKEIIRMIKLKSGAHNRYLRTQLHFHYQEFKRLRTLTKSMVKDAYRRYVGDVQESLFAEPKRFWSFVSRKSGNSSIPKSVHYNGNVAGTPQDVVNAFADFFSGVYIKNNNYASRPSMLPPSFSDVIDFSSNAITVEEVESAIRKLKDNFTTGPDGVPAFVVRDCCRVLALPLSIIFNKSLHTSTFPGSWKTAKVCPVFKKGDKADVNNYRPIAILSNFAKVFEIVIFNRLYPLVRHQISSYQHGFVDRRSTCSNLACMSQYLSKVVDSHGQVDVIYTDFSKAFDRLHQGLLLQKLERFGLNEPCIRFLRSYLLDRVQFVRYNGYDSHLFAAHSGVPQGSNLGPLFFVLFINDLLQQLECCRLCYADDLKIYKKISSITDCLDLQRDLDVLWTWCNVNCLCLNLTKCCVVSYSLKRSRIIYNYNIDDHVLARMSEVSDLGVIFDDKLRFTRHIRETVSGAMKSLGFIKRSCADFNDPAVLTVLYNAYVKSRVSYASLIWCPQYEFLVGMVERVQRRFLKYLEFKTTGVYPPQGIDYQLLLEPHGFSSLRFDRDRTAVNFLHGLLNGSIDCPDLIGALDFLVPRLGSRLSATFYCPAARTNIMLKSPVYRMSSIFNNIARCCDINTCTIKQLSVALKEYFSHL